MPLVYIKYFTYICNMIEEEIETTFIYSLVDPREENSIRYIGKSNNPNERLLQHIKEGLSDRKSKKINWIKKIIREGVIPKLIIIKEVPLVEWSYWEKYYYNLYKQNHKLTNLKECGLGEAKHHLETIEKLREISISRSKRGIEHHMYGKVLTDEHKLKMQQGRIIKPRQTVKIYQYDYNTNELIKIHNSIKECALKLGISRNSIDECVIGYRVVRKGVRKNIYQVKGNYFTKEEL